MHFSLKFCWNWLLILEAEEKEEEGDEKLYQENGAVVVVVQTQNLANFCSVKN